MRYAQWLNNAIKNCLTNKPPAKNAKRIPEKPNIQRHNFTSRFDPFIIFEPGNEMEYLNDRDIRSLQNYGSCNHWPVGEPNCDGRVAQTGDRPTHFLGFPISDPVIREDGKNRSHWAGLYGMTDKPIAELVRLGRAGARPPAVRGLKGKLVYTGFDTPQRAFVFENSLGNEDSVGWEWAASLDSPLIRPVVILNNGTAAVREIVLNGKILEEGRDYQLGEVKTLEGIRTVISLNFESEQKTIVELKTK